MRTVRIDKDYMNYRTLVNILKEYVSSEIFNVVYNYRVKDNPEYEEIKSKTIVLEKWINSEINHVKELLDDSLKKKDYKNFKVLSQSDIVLRWIGGRIGELKWI